jgi:hypothetical protein
MVIATCIGVALRKDNAPEADNTLVMRVDHELKLWQLLNGAGRRQAAPNTNPRRRTGVV